MKINKQVPEIARDIFENLFFNFYFLDVNIFLIICTTSLIFSKHVTNITVKGTVSQIRDIDPGSFFRKYGKKIFRKKN